MKRTELITRTGLGRGRLLSGVGQNITDNPDGAGNEQVGTFALDFSSVFQTGSIGGDGVLANVAAVDNEYTVILADTRGLDGDELGDDNDLLSDATDPEEEDGAFITPDVQWARVDRVTIDWRFVGPTYRDASVWVISPENGEIQTNVGDLESVLDALDASPLVEADNDVDIWHLAHAHLRWTLHWALMVIDCTSVNDQGLADFARENSTLAFRNNPVPVGGPSGLLILYGSAADGTQGIRLWQPAGGASGVRIVARGEREYPYQYRNRVDTADPAAQVDFDILDPDAGSTTAYRVENASTRAEGRNVHLRLNLERPVTLRDDQLLVLTVQTGRARLARRDSDPPNQDAVIAGPNSLDGSNGPLLRMYHHYTQVSGVVR